MFILILIIKLLANMEELPDELLVHIFGFLVEGEDVNVEGEDEAERRAMEGFVRSPLPPPR